MITVTLLVMLTPLFLLLTWLAIESRTHRKRRQLAKLTAAQTIESAISAPAQAPSGEAVPTAGKARAAASSASSSQRSGLP